MNAILQLAQAHPVYAGAIAAAVLVALYFLLNIKSAATKDAERRISQLQDDGRDRYRGSRPLR
jgi:hypothetical protein